MILGVEVQEDPLQNISNLFTYSLIGLVGLYIMASIHEALKPLTKKQMQERIILLESRIVTKTVELQNEVIIP